MNSKTPILFPLVSFYLYAFYVGIYISVYIINLLKASNLTLGLSIGLQIASYFGNKCGLKCLKMQICFHLSKIAVVLIFQNITKYKASVERLTTGNQH